MRIESYFDVILKGESNFWIISRSSDVLNKFSAVVKISKEDRCQKVFASFGTFVNDAKGNMYFKIFLKQQLINFSSILTINKKLKISISMIMIFVRSKDIYRIMEMIEFEPNSSVYLYN